MQLKDFLLYGTEVKKFPSLSSMEYLENCNLSNMVLERVPSEFINTKMKEANPNWNKIPLTPLNLSLRNEIGISVEKDQVKDIAEKIDMLLEGQTAYQDKILKIREKYLFNFGESGRAGGSYILKRVMKTT